MQKKLKNHERACTDEDYCFVEMPNDNNKILKYQRGEKSLKASFMVYVEVYPHVKNTLMPK